MSSNISDLFFWVRSALFLPRLVLTADIPKPDRGGAAPTELVNLVKVGLNLVAWAGTAAGVSGVIVTGTMMAMAHRRGEASEHMSRLGMVLGGCILVAVAGPLVQFVFNNGLAQ
ncbi:hypothetical protein ACIA5C_44930 [Actinoplanes sp. NPDC051343]|uniref:hypothetical protein n=1 Tax=Actinoplanes sp. NPDC051343 TaxID=3363906 RepID=UPI003789F3CE